MPSTKPNMIDALRAKHDPHYKLASKVSGLQDASGRVDKLEKDIAAQLKSIHNTSSKSFGLQRKTLVRVLGLEKRLTVSDTRISNIETGIEIWTSREAARRQKEEEEKAALAQQVAEQEAALAEKVAAQAAAQAVLAEQAAQQAAEEAAAQAAQELEQVAEEVEQAAEKVVDVAEELGVEDEIPEGLDDVLGDIRAEDGIGGADGAGGLDGIGADGTSGVGGLDGLDGTSGSSGVSTKIDPSKTKPKKKKPAAKKKKPKKKRPPIKAKKKKISAKDLAKGTPFDAGFKSRVLGEDEKGEYLSPEERKRRFKLGDKQEKDGLSKTVEDVSQTQQPASPLDGVIGVVNSIAGSVDSIRETLIGQQKVSQEQVSEQREEKQKKKRGMKEKALEAGGKIMGGAKKVGEKILAPVKGMWTKLMDFLIGVLLGKAVMSLFEWFTDPANQDKVSSLFKFLKDWWPVLLASIMAFVPALLGPGGFIIGTIALLAWGIPKIINIVKSIFSFGKGVDKELKNVDKDAEKTGADLGKNIEDDAKKLGGDAPETGDPEKSPQPAELGDVDKSQKDLQNVPPEPKKMKEGGPVESKEGGQIRGEKGDDKVPAMLTDGEFVLSKGAVQAYGVDTLASMNAAAGGTNKPTMKGGRAGYSGGGPVGDYWANRGDTSHFGTTGYRMGQVLPEQLIYNKETFTSSSKWKNGEVIEDKETYTELGGSIGMPDLIEHQKQLVSAIRKVEGYENINFMDVVQYPNGQGRLVGMPEEKLYPIFNSSDAWKASDAKRDAAMKLDDENNLQFLDPNKVAEKIGGFNKGGLVPAFAGGGLVESISNIMTMSDGGNVPGSGNTDTVPAMLTPGEFVMNKASTAKIGVQNLMKMNANMGKGILGGAKKLAMKHPLAQMASGIGNLVGGAKDKLSEMMGGGDEDKVFGIAVADIPKGSPLMKSAKPPAGDAIKPPMKSSDKGGVEVISGKGSGGGQGMAGSGGGKMLPLIDPAKKVSASKIAVLGITV